MPDLTFRNARIATPGGLALHDIGITDGRIETVTLSSPGRGRNEGMDLDGDILLPGFVDLHTHIDKGHIWPRAFNADGTHGSAVQAVMADRTANWSAEDVAARAGFSLRCAHAHGTVALRTHLDSLGPQLDISWPVFTQLRAEWAGRIALQAVALVQLDAYATPFADRMADVVAEAGGLLGGTGATQPDIVALVARVFDLAVDRNLDVDLHVDETGDPAAHMLRVVAHETVRRNWHGRVTCGHCCSLAVQDPAFARETIAAVAAAGITVVSLPMVNSWLQGRRAPQTPVWRGITLVHELRAAGVRVVFGSDNTRDPFFGFGDLDLLEVFREAVRIGHLDFPVDDWASTVNTLPADVMDLPVGRIAPGAPADLIRFKARSWSELLSRPQSDRIVLRAGVAIDSTPPSYRELDGLFG